MVEINLQVDLLLILLKIVFMMDIIISMRLR